MAEQTPPVVLTIAGSDSGGGAGIQADLRTFAFHQVHGTCALTCVTAQNTLGVNRVDALPPEAVTAQIMAIALDIGINAVKTGMLLNQAIIAVVADHLRTLGPQPKVIDPVMVSRAGVQLLDDRAIATLCQELLPLATVVTPNRYEAQILSHQEIQDLTDMEMAARRIYDLGPQTVLVKGGGMGGNLKGVDLWFNGQDVEIFTTHRVATRHTHGTGCTLSAAIAANLALGKDLKTAIDHGKNYVTQALEHSLALGGGQGPVGHFFPLVGGLSLAP